MVSRRLLRLLAQALSVNSLPGNRNVATGPTVNLGYSIYEGVRLAAGVDQYLGMRFAQAPLGDLRFRMPENPVSTNATQSASQFGPTCIGVGQTESSSVGEDCLFVNVFTPSNATAKSKLPVWLYIQGGGYKSNSNSNYNGSDVVQKSGGNLVFVNFNYRVGSLGFLASEKVREDGDLNVGLLDQRKLLQWVQKHIGKFGGDPDHVVIHGTSAGGGSVSHHLTAYGGRDDHLFIGAAPQSIFWPTQRTVREMEFQFDRFVNDTACSGEQDPISCLRSASLSIIMAASAVSPFPGASNTPLPLWYWLPVVDGGLIPDLMYKLFQEGKFVKVPILVANTDDEGASFASNATNSSDMAAFFKNNYPKLSSIELQQLIETYPLQPAVPKHAAYFPSTAAAYGDATFICPGHELASTFSHYVAPDHVWNYRFNVQDPDSIAAGLGTAHAVDVPAILGPGYSGSAYRSYSDVNAAIVPITMDYWISFIRSLDPNKYRAPDAPVWEPWGTGTGRRLKLETNATQMELVPETLIGRCALWRDLSTSMDV
ncbi:Alpha/Beta hydrolase protein [Pseudomassariella vexata]|uniref:Carboxylic ester hydrolase n=1 Tax=Pseudomassariella vexata TaxID=1141098 RepID=A0A1Y2DQT8_9PEZI|nr:Alpha/Beta hydrolase protein [Pseudomassariella vexata]ORY61476.1 Alpha/Beta hydrolase protein [Pseudomassariella vexata]